MGNPPQELSPGGGGGHSQDHRQEGDIISIKLLFQVGAWVGTQQGTQKKKSLLTFHPQGWELMENPHSAPCTQGLASPQQKDVRDTPTIRGPETVKWQYLA